MRVITLLVLSSIIIIQMVRKRLMTSASMWVFFHLCFFVVSPLLLQFSYNDVDHYGMIAAISFFFGYVISVLLSPKKQRNNGVNETDIDDGYKIESKADISCIINVNRNTKYIMYFMIVVFFVFFGISGALHVLSGTRTATSLIVEGGILYTLYDYSKQWAGLALVACLVSQKGKIRKNNVLLFAIITILYIFFSFTRSPYVVVIGMILMYILRDSETIKQLLFVLLGIIGISLLMSIIMVIRVWGVGRLKSIFSYTYFLNSLTNSLDFTIGYQRFHEFLSNPVRISPVVYLKTLYAIIPRSIWATKPLRGTMEIFKQINYQGFLAGYSTGYTNLGVPMAAFGEIGAFIAPFLWGIVTSSLDNSYIRAKNKKSINNIFMCFYLYFSVCMVLQSFREGTDVALLDLPINMLVIWLVYNLNIKTMKLRIK